MKDKNFNKIHKLYKDIKSVELEHGFINVIISLPIKDICLNDYTLKGKIQEIYKLKIKLFSLCIFRDEVHFSYEVKE